MMSALDADGGKLLADEKAAVGRGDHHRPAEARLVFEAQQRPLEGGGTRPASAGDASAGNRCEAGHSPVPAPPHMIVGIICMDRAFMLALSVLEVAKRLESNFPQGVSVK